MLLTAAKRAFRHLHEQALIVTRGLGVSFVLKVVVSEGSGLRGLMASQALPLDVFMCGRILHDRRRLQNEVY
jgi:hypothetical protein